MNGFDVACIHSPVGLLEISGSNAGIRSVLFLETGEASQNIPPSLLECVNQLNAYFSGKLQQFEINIDPFGTPFQLRVWKALTAIPYGTTISYLDLACQTGNKANTRAVGNANGKNKLNIIVPCHRVIGSGGALTGYGGGLWRKEFLLRHEMSNKLPGLFAEI